MQFGKDDLGTKFRAAAMTATITLFGMITCALPSAAGTFSIENPGDSSVTATLSQNTTSSYQTIGSSFKWENMTVAGVALNGSASSITDNIASTFHVRIIWTPTSMRDIPPAAVKVVAYVEGMTYASGTFTYTAQGTSTAINTSDTEQSTASISGKGSGLANSHPQDFHQGSLKFHPAHAAWTIYGTISRLADGRYGYDAYIETAYTQIQASIGISGNDPYSSGNCGGELGRNIWIHSLTAATAQNTLTGPVTVLDGLR